MLKVKPGEHRVCQLFCRAPGGLSRELLPTPEVTTEPDIQWTRQIGQTSGHFYRRYSPIVHPQVLTYDARFIPDLDTTERVEERFSFRWQ